MLFTARNGAVLSGRVWATRAGPAKRPGIVITDGSVQAPEQLYGVRRGKVTFVGASRDRRAQLLWRVRAAF